MNKTHLQRDCPTGHHCRGCAPMFYALQDVEEKCKREAEEKARADAQALADVRTLDEYDPDWMARGALPGGFCVVRDGITPEAARAKAAAWVREQSKL